MAVGVPVFGTSQENLAEKTAARLLDVFARQVAHHVEANQASLRLKLEFMFETATFGGTGGEVLLDLHDYRAIDRSGEQAVAVHMVGPTGGTCLSPEHWQSPEIHIVDDMFPGTETVSAICPIYPKHNGRISTFGDTDLRLHHVQRDAVVAPSSAVPIIHRNSVTQTNNQGQGFYMVKQILPEERRTSECDEFASQSTVADHRVILDRREESVGMFVYEHLKRRGESD